MDPLSITLGVAPLCLTAIGGAKFVIANLKILRHRDREVSRLRKKL